MRAEPAPGAAREIPPPENAVRPKRWLHRITTFLLVIFCFELGIFLLIAPWWGAFWENNFFSTVVGQQVWTNAYFRGAVSGIGVVNLCIALAEAYGLRT